MPDYMYRKCGKRPASTETTVILNPITPADFHGSNSFDRVRSMRDALPNSLPNSSRSATASSGLGGRSYTNQSSSSRRGRTRSQDSSRLRQHSRNPSTREPETLPKSGRKNATPSSRHRRSPSDYTSSSYREGYQRRHSLQPREYLSSRTSDINEVGSPYVHYAHYAQMILDIFPDISQRFLLKSVDKIDKKFVSKAKAASQAEFTINWLLNRTDIPKPSLKSPSGSTVATTKAETQPRQPDQKPNASTAATTKAIAQSQQPDQKPSSSSSGFNVSFWFECRHRLVSAEAEQRQ